MGILALVPLYSTGCLWAISEAIDDDHGCDINAYWDGDQCVCDDGYVCDPYVECSPLVEQFWYVVDGCDDLRDVEFRLFSDAGDAAWPSWDEVFLTSGFDVRAPVSIECILGEVICYGAQSSLKTWGCGLNDDVVGCDNSCFVCDYASAPEEILLCN